MGWLTAFMSNTKMALVEDGALLGPRRFDMGNSGLDRDQYLQDMTQGLATWAQARAAGIDEQTIGRQREVRNVYYQEYLRGCF